MTRNKENKKYIGLVRVIIINLLIMLISLIIFGWRFETPDDSVMSLMASDGIQGEHLIYINIILGKAISVLFNVIPNINWYGAIMYIIAFVGLVTLTYIIYKIVNRKVAFIVVIMFLGVFGVDIYSNMQYTKVSALISIAGMLLIHVAFKDKFSWVGRSILGLTLFLIGTMLRIETLPITIVFIGLLFLCDIYYLYKEKNSTIDIIKLKFKYILFNFFAIILCLILQLVNVYVYNSDEMWKSYSSYNQARTAVLDYDIADYEKYSDEYNEIGLSYIDVCTLKSWLNGDPKVFDTDTLIKIREIESSKLILEDSLEKFFNSVIGCLSYGIVRSTILLMCIYFLLINKKTKSYIVASGIGVIILYTILSIKGRNAYRVEYGIWISAFMISIYSMKNILLKRERIIKNILVIVLILTIAIGANNYNIKKIMYRNEVTKKWGSMFDEIRNNKEEIFFYDPMTLASAYTSIGPLEYIEKNEFVNLIPIGGWTVYTARVNEMWRVYNVENPFEDLVKKENAYYISNASVDIILSYIKENYYPNARYEKVKELDYAQIYKFYEK